MVSSETYRTIPRRPLPTCTIASGKVLMAKGRMGHTNKPAMPRAPSGFLPKHHHESENQKQ